MDYEEEIKRLRRLNMKMYMTMANIITILNERESEELLMMSLNNIKREIIIDEEIKKEELIINFYNRLMSYEEEIKKMKEDLIKLKKDLKFLMTKQKEREANVSKYFTYESSEDDCEVSCGCGKPPHQPCPEIEEYLKSISD
jgi:hypothetical protein